MMTPEKINALVSNVLADLGYSPHIVDRIEILPDGGFIIRYKVNAVGEKDVSRIAERLNAHIYGGERRVS